MNEVTVTMSHKKDTKRTVVYQAEEDGSPVAIKTLYIQKWALQTPPPEFIAVTVKEVD